MQVRNATADDMGFVVETFLRSIRAASTHVEGLDNGRVVGLLTALIDKGWGCAVADAEGFLAGWAVFGTGNHLAWVYVRDMFREQGVCKQLLRFADIDVTKRIVTPFMPNRNKSKWALVHRPFLVIK